MPGSTIASHSLAEVHPGDRARVTGFLFPSVARYAAEVGLGPGMAVRCRGANSTVIVLDDANDHTVVVEMDWARFIQIERIRAAPSGL